MTLGPWWFFDFHSKGLHKSDLIPFHSRNQGWNIVRNKNKSICHWNTFFKITMMWMTESPQIFVNNTNYRDFFPTNHTGSGGKPCIDLFYSELVIVLHAVSCMYCLVVVVVLVVVYNFTYMSHCDLMEMITCLFCVFQLFVLVLQHSYCLASLCSIQRCLQQHQEFAF